MSLWETLQIQTGSGKLPGMENVQHQDLRSRVGLPWPPGGHSPDGHTDFLGDIGGRVTTQ